jgi:pyrroline-5-carboxylate reductase
VGEIGRAPVTGLCEGVAEPSEIHLSPRGARTAAELSRRYASVQVRADNQDVVEHSDVVILASVRTAGPRRSPGCGSGTTAWWSA